MKCLSLLLVALLVAGCAAPPPPGPNLLPLPLPTPSPTPVVNTTAVQNVRIMVASDRDVAEALRGVSAGFADCLRRDAGAKVKNTEQVRAAWMAALAFQFEGTPLFKRVPGLGGAVDTVLTEAAGGLDSKLIDDAQRTKFVTAFDSLAAALQGI